MSKHKFKVEDVVTTKPMRIKGIVEGYCVELQTHCGKTEYLSALDLIPIPATDADVVEQVARHLCEAAGDNWDAKNFNETLTGQEPEENRDGYRGQARDAITALTSSGYTRSPKPVNQMMLEALKPFAKVADAIDAIPMYLSCDTEIVHYTCWEDVGGKTTYEDFRKARAAISAGSEG